MKRYLDFAFVLEALGIRREYSRKTTLSKLFLLSVLLLQIAVCDAQQQPSRLDSSHQSPAQNDSIPTAAKTKRFLFDQTRPWTAYTLAGDDILRLPVRGIENYFPLLPGVIDLAEYRPSRANSTTNTLHVRGSRTGEIRYLLDGFSTTNPFTNSNDFPLIPEAIEELEVHPGAYGPELGSANGGVVASRMRTGGNALKISLNYRGDELVSPGNEFLNTTSNGVRNIVGTASGPLTDRVSFFLAGEHAFAHNRDPIFLEPFRYDSLRTDGAYFYPAGIPLPGPVEFRKNYLAGNWAETNSIQGNVRVNLEPFELKLIGAYSFEEKPLGRTWGAANFRSDALKNIFWQKQQLNEVSKTFLALRATHVLDPSTSYAVGLSYHRRRSRTYDKDYGDEWMLYADSTAARSKGYILKEGSLIPGFQPRLVPGSTGWWDLRNGPSSYSAIYAFNFNHEFTPVLNYSKDVQTSFALSFDGTSRITPEWELKAGMRYEQWTMRLWDIQWINNLMSFIDYSGNYYSTDSLRRYPDRIKERDYRFAERSNIDYYGYDVLGEEIEGGPSAPRTPRFLSLFFNNEVVDGRVTLNLGGRYESYWSDLLVYPDDDPTFRKYAAGKNYSYFLVVDADKMIEQKASQYFLPRANMSFRWEDKGILFLSYGEYAQLTDLKQVYHGLYQINRAIQGAYSQWDPLTQRYRPVWGGIVGQQAKPERSRQIEIGFRHALPNEGAISVSYYQKKMRDQLQLGIVNDTAFVDFLNTGEGVSQGLDVSLSLHLSQTIQLGLLYSFHDSYGTTSNATSNAREYVGDYYYKRVRTPTSQPPLDFSVRHRGTAYIAAKGIDGDPILDRTELLFLLNVSSGHPYTRIEPMRFGSLSPLYIGSAPLQDVRLADPIEPLNSSLTPWILRLDLRFSKEFVVNDVRIRISTDVTNLLNTKSVLNVYPTSGSANDDGWLSSIYADWTNAIPNFSSFYRDVNLKNGWGYVQATGNNMYGPPRQIRLGLTVWM
ncbi:MAG: Outer rane receptor protein, mostly Fe transport [Bacteroidetes bacterium]|nr:Outer rane receptor protein, mostly Fe transport [Bacteroidota bacterium]